MSALPIPNPVPHPRPRTGNLKELLHQLGDVAPDRVLIDPPLGAATERDVVAAHTAENRLCELLDGILVEKVMGYAESILALAIAEALRAFVRPRKLGLVSGPDGMVRLFPGLIRIPDVAYVSWERVPERRMPTEPAPDLIPDLAIEVLSPANTPAEMQRKLADYFTAGVRLVWTFDLETRSVAVYTSPDTKRIRNEGDTLDGDEVLPGFSLSLKDIFGELDERQQ